jgi:hypothetical protein
MQVKAETSFHPIAALTAATRRHPGRLLALVLFVHFIVWSALPFLVDANLPLDLAEDLALGKEWQIGYWKHPPLPWWVADLALRTSGSIDAVYILGPLAAVICLYGVWLLGRNVVGPFAALLAVLPLEGIHFYNFSAVKFAHDQMQLPFWAFTALFFHRAIIKGNMKYWLLAGALLAGAFWSKYAAFALAASLGLFLLVDPAARRSWGTPGPYLMALTFVIVIAPNAMWVVDHDFLPFRYVDERAQSAVHWYDYLVHPLRWVVSQVQFTFPALVLMALLYGRADGGLRPCAGEAALFDRRYVTALALGPFAVTTIVAAMLGRLPVAMWGYPLWSFGPLAIVMWLKPISDDRPLHRFAVAFIAIFIAFPLVYAAVELWEPLVNDRHKAAIFPGRALAETITQQWRDRTGTALVYVGGAEVGTGPGEIAVNNVAVYSPDRPHVIVHGNPRLSPWIDLADLERRGAVFVWEQETTDPFVPAHLRETFSRLEMQPPIALARQNRFSRAPEIIGYAVVPPQR